MLIAAVVGGIVGTAIACGVMAVIIARRPATRAGMTPGQAAEYTQMLAELANPERAARGWNRRREVYIKFLGAVNATLDNPAAGLGDLHGSLDLLRIEGPEALAMQAEALVSVLGQPGAGEQAREDFIAAAREALAMPLRMGKCDPPARAAREGL